LGRARCSPYADYSPPSSEGSQSDDKDSDGGGSEELEGLDEGSDGGGSDELEDVGEVSDGSPARVDCEELFSALEPLPGSMCW
jgi:hypothetical protein